MVDDITSAIRLIRSDNVGPRTYFGLVKRFGSALGAIDQLHEITGKKQITIYPLEKAEAEIAAAEKLGIKILLHSDADYPENLLNTYDAPPVLFYKGNLALLKNARWGLSVRATLRLMAARSRGKLRPAWVRRELRWCQVWRGELMQRRIRLRLAQVRWR